MRRLPIIASLLAGFALATAADVAAQERELRYIRESLYRVNYGDMVPFVEFFNEHGAPILEAMTEAGTIQGFSIRTHDTGGEFNVRLTTRFWDWASIQPSIDQLIAELTEAAPADELAAMRNSILDHQDEIWEVQEINITEGAGPSPYLYNASFQVGAGNMPRWMELWESSWRGGLEAAMAAGHLNGYVTLTHAHGGADNFKVIELFSDWDSIDDAFGAMVGAIGEDALGEIFSLIDAHHDNIWITGVFGEDGN